MTPGRIIGSGSTPTELPAVIAIIAVPIGPA
jgi:hypothetical protein